MTVRLSRLRIAGFKSFADPVEIDVLPGLTGIVGPNGCGKSNVADALRWVMGEANPRMLRGGEMDDVIFAGTDARPRRHMAEVSITLRDDGGNGTGDEPGRGFPGALAGLDEVQVTRRIERGSGSAYTINGRDARASVVHGSVGWC